MATVRMTNPRNGYAKTVNPELVGLHQRLGYVVDEPAEADSKPTKPTPRKGAAESSGGDKDNK